MSSVLALTTFDQIRGVLTVSKADLPDRTLTGYGLEDDLTIDLEDWLGEWSAVADAGTDRQKMLLKLYAKYRCAAWVAASGQNFTLTQFSDGANAGQRSDTEGFQELRAHMEGRAGHYRRMLDEELESVAAAERPPLMGRVRPSRDPVLEGRS
jgi:hypothetical protein